jgi:cytochrome c oxidase assembly protein subunit 15
MPAAAPRRPAAGGGRSRFARLVALVTLPLLVAGALVTSTGSGMATDEWPWAYGQWFPSLSGGLRYEHVHRIWGATVGALAVVLAIWTWRADSRPRVRGLGVAAVALVIVQGLLGGLTVVLNLPPPVSIAHAFLAQTFFCVVAAVAIVTAPWWEGEPVPRGGGPPPPGLRRHALLGLAVGFGQLLLGAVLRHTGQGLVLHLVGAVVVIAVVWPLLARVFREHRNDERLEGAAVTVVLLLVAQVFLGFGAYVTKYLAKPTPEPPMSAVLFTTLHVALGALMLAAILSLALRIARAAAGGGPRLAGEPVPAGGSAAVASAPGAAGSAARSGEPAPSRS